MGSHLIRDGLLGTGTLIVALYCFVTVRTVVPSQGGVFESVAWGKLVVGFVYACMAGLFFWMSARGF